MELLGAAFTAAPPSSASEALSLSLPCTQRRLQLAMMQHYRQHIIS
jgi:hypothetical protein